MALQLGIFAFAILVLAPLARAMCECGYTVNVTGSKEYSLFTNVLETDFGHLARDALDYNKRNSTGWAMQIYSQSADVARNGGHYGQNVTASNIIINPLKDKSSWTGEGELGGDAGLQLYVRAEDINDEISSGEIVTIRDDILYGSFRVGVKMTGVPGTCGAFFWYRNDSQEIDIEYLSYQQAPNETFDETYHPINLVIQTPQSAAAGFNAAGTPDYDVVPLPFAPDEGFHEFRFDWSPDEVSYYADGKCVSTMRYDIPNSPGQIFLNHWSNGNPGWSRGPPQQDALMTVSYVKAYFNTTSDTDGDDFAKACTAKYQSQEWTDHTCVIPDQPDFFFTQGLPPPPPPPGSGQPPNSTATNSPGPNAPVKPKHGQASIHNMVTWYKYILPVALATFVSTGLLHII